MTCNHVRERLDEYVDGELGPAARLGLGLHLLRCAACRGAVREARVLTRQLAGLPWPANLSAVVAERMGVRPRPRPARLRRLAAGVVVAMVLIPPAVALWARHAASLGAGTVAAIGDRKWSVTAKTPEGKAIWSVHYVVTYTSGGGTAMPALSDDVKIQYPDKMRDEPLDTDGTIVVRNGDRELADLSRGPGLLNADGKHYRCVIERPEGPLPSPDGFTETGVIELGLIFWSDGSQYGLGPMGAAMYPSGKEVFERTEEAGQNGERVLVVKHTKADVPSFRGTYRIRVDPASHLVLGWDNQVESRYPVGSPREREVREYREIVEHVEYNVVFPSDVFRVEAPAGVAPSDVLDRYSPESIKKDYEETLRLWETNKTEQTTAQAALGHRVGATRFPRLDVLSPAEQQEIRARAGKLGIEIP